MFYFEALRRAVSSIWDTKKADVKKEGEEIIQCFWHTRAEQAKRRRGKALRIWVVQGQQNHKGADAESLPAFYAACVISTS